MSNLKDLKAQFRNIVFPVMEVEVIDLRTSKEEIASFHLSIVNKDNMILTQHEAMSIEEYESDTISHFFVALDDTFSLDEHLAFVHEKCIQTISASEYYDFRSEE